MRYSRVPMPIYPGRRKGTRRVVVSLLGQQHEWIVEGTKAEAEAFEARKRVELQASALSDRTSPRFGDWCEHKYQSFAEANLKRSTWQSRIHHVARLVEFFGQKKLTEISAGDVEAYKAWRRREAKLRPSSMNKELSAFRAVMNTAASMGYPMTLPPIVFLKESRGRARIWTDADVARLLEISAARHAEMTRILVFLLNTGCRKGEAIAAEWSWVDLPGAMLRIPANEAWSPKNGRAREVPLSDACLSALAPPRASERWVFPNRNGGRHRRFPDPLFEEIQDRAGLSGGIHTTRHVFASSFLQAVPDLFLLAQVLGHSHGRVTELYAHLLPGHLNRARNAVNILPPPQKLAVRLADKMKPAGKTA